MAESRRRGTRRSALGLPGREANELDKERLGVRRGQLLVDHLFAKEIEHLHGVDIGLHVVSVYQV